MVGGALGQNGLGEFALGGLVLGQTGFRASAAPTGSWTAQPIATAGFTGTAQPTASFATGGAFQATADPRAQFTAVRDAAFIATASPQASWSPTIGTNETCLVPSVPDAQTAPNYVY